MRRATSKMLAVLITMTMAATTARAASAPSIPDTPAGRVFAAWLAMFNSADRATMEAFDRQYRSEPRDVERTLQFREETGGFTLVRIEKSEPTALTALLAEKGSDTVTRPQRRSGAQVQRRVPALKTPAPERSV